MAREPRGNAPGGLIVVDKPGGMTSHDVVARIRRLAGTRRVGHAGTLDPMATGVLVVGVEKATRLLGHLTLTDKEYQATIRLGQATDTGDAEGTVIPAGPAAQLPPGQLPPGQLPPGQLPPAQPAPARLTAARLTLAQVRAAAAALTGDIQQVPPTVSAIKVAGRRAYQLTREGTPPVLGPRPVTVWSFTVQAVRPAPGAGPDGGPGELLDADVEVRCSSGTYIRALARDMGEALGVGGHLTRLRRTRVGPYDLGAAHGLDELAQQLTVLPLAEAAAQAFPVRQLTEDEARSLSHGGRLAALGRDVPLGPGETAGPVAALGPDGTLIALVEEKDGVARPLAVFVP